MYKRFTKWTINKRFKC